MEEFPLLHNFMEESFKLRQVPEKEPNANKIQHRDTQLG